MKRLLLILFCIISFLAYSQDTSFLKVHFLYGSKPLKEYKNIERKSFGGILGGHVGIEGDSGEILNFLPKGKFHWFPHKNNKHSTFSVDSLNEFLASLGGNPDSVKYAIVYVPISQLQKQKYDSIASAYLKKTPYDYAFFGMRCAAATYEILGQLNILPNYSYRKTSKKVFYPKKLRKRLLEKAKDNNWRIIRQNGSSRRKWEQD